MVHVGALKGPHGLKGLVKAKLNLDDANLVLSGTLVLPDGRALTVTHWQPVGQGLVALRIQGVETIEQAEALRGKPVQMDRSAWPEVAGEVFLDTFVGRAVHDEAGTAYGTVKAVVALPAGPALEITPLDGGKTHLVPALPDFVTLTETAILTPLGVAVIQL